MIVVCKQCGKRLEMRFDDIRSHKGFCSFSCRNEYYTHTCNYCGKEFVASSIKQLFCSRECSNKSASLKYREKHKERKDQCVVCGKIVSKDSKYCSIDCMKKEKERLSGVLDNLDRAKATEAKRTSTKKIDVQVKGLPNTEERELRASIERLQTKKPKPPVDIPCRDVTEDMPSEASESHSKAKKTESDTNILEARRCVYCGNSFIPKMKTQVYCSVKCRNSEAKEKISSRPDKPVKDRKRKCHDCGRPTNDYRCEKCWAKRRRGYEGVDE